MNLVELLSGFAENLIEFMAFILFLALFLRYMAYRMCASTQTYVKTLSRSIEKNVLKVENHGKIDSWMKELFSVVEKDMPNRGIRFQNKKQAMERFANKNKQTSIDDFIAVKRSLTYNITQQTDALRIPVHPPDFLELSNRVMAVDPYWNKIYQIIPVSTLQRVLSMLPGLYIIGGIFGTFIGITAALPMIAEIDLSNLDASAPILNQFVGNIAYSMNTSIAGIIFSVIMTLLNTLFPLETVRNDVEENMASIFENLWIQIHKDKLWHGEKEIIAKLEQLVELQKAMIPANNPKQAAGNGF